MGRRKPKLEVSKPTILKSERVSKKAKKTAKTSASEINKNSVKLDNVQDEANVNTINEICSVKKQKKPFLNEDEAQVKEEDIDNFIEELDEKDNEQYEDWIKLVEAKLHSNSNKKSS